MHATYPEFSDRVCERWRKTVPAMVVVYRLNPYHLDAPPGDVVLSGDAGVVELYSEREAYAFAQLNRRLIETGVLTRDTGRRGDGVELTNAPSDDELRALLALKPQAFASRLRQFTSPIPLRRMQELLTEDTSMWIVKAITNRLAELERAERSDTPERAESADSER